MSVSIDHLVVLVNDLDAAMKTYSELGFQVTPGGQHPVGTHNALITFADGSYLELIAFMEPDKPSQHRWYQFLRPGGGFVDFALAVDDVDEVLEQVRGRDLAYVGPNAGARRRPDGQELSWRTGTPPSDRTGELPFIIDDITARELRVPGGDAARHANGVVGVRSITIAVRDLGEAAEEFSALLGQEAGPVEADESIQADTVTFAIGEQRLILAYPNAPTSPIARRIQRMGDGPYTTALLVSGDAGNPLDPEAVTQAGLRCTIVEA